MDQQPKRSMDGMGPRPGMDGMMRRPEAAMPPAAAAPAPVSVQPKRSFGRSAAKPKEATAAPVASVPPPAAPAVRPAKPASAPAKPSRAVAPDKPSQVMPAAVDAASPGQQRRWLRAALQGIAWLAVILGVAAVLIELYVRYYQ